MDIVKRAYLKVKEEMEDEQDSFQLQGKGTLHIFNDRVRDEIIRLIKVRAYSGRDWPRELGPIPDELRAKAKRRENELSFDEIYKAVNSQIPIHYPINKPINIYAVNAADAVVGLLKVRGVNVDGCREDLVEPIKLDTVEVKNGI